MAQKTEKEETEFKVVPETITLCVKCGVAGNSAASNLCQKCLNTTTSASVAAAATATATATSTATSKNLVFGEQSLRFSSSPRFDSERNLTPGNKSVDLKKDVPEESSPLVKREINRCSGCRRKVGLTGFRCRCGDLFCSEHRYSDRHDCSFDYKAAGRESIARENPVVKAAKIFKI